MDLVGIELDPKGLEPLSSLTIRKNHYMLSQSVYLPNEPTDKFVRIVPS